MDQKLVLNKIQELLKVKGWTYLSLSKRIGLSHPALKRIFSKKQITFENLIRICEVLDFSLSDLFYEVEQENLKAFRFSDEQERFFAENPHYLSYFYQIRAKKTPAQIQRQFSLSDKSTAKYVRKLKNFGLIKLEGREFVSATNLPIAWEDDGPLGTVFSSRMIEDLVHRGISAGQVYKKPSLDLKNFVLSKNQYQELVSAFHDLAEKYQSLSAQNSKLKKKTDVAATSLVIVGERQFNLFEDIREI
jgi:DNA-binding Xre family transcriptional regulator